MELEAGQRVVLHGLKGAAELNGREGVLRGAADAATGRWEVCLARRGAEGAKAVRVKAANLRPAAGEGQLGQGQQAQAPAPPAAASAAALGAAPAAAGNGAAPAGFRPTALAARPGKFKASYDWRAVLEGQELPRGMEVLASLGGDTPMIARIPTKWRLEVDCGAGATALRMDVRGGNGRPVDGGEWTTVGDVQAALRAHLGRGGGAGGATERAGEGWPALLVDGRRVADSALSIVAAQLFGAKVSCAIHVDESMD